MLLPCLGEMCASRNIGVRVSLINTVLLLLLLLLLFNIYPKITLLSYVSLVTYLFNILRENHIKFQAE